KIGGQEARRGKGRVHHHCIGSGSIEQLVFERMAPLVFQREILAAFNDRDAGQEDTEMPAAHIGCDKKQDNCKSLGNTIQHLSARKETALPIYDSAYFLPNRSRKPRRCSLRSDFSLVRFA